MSTIITQYQWQYRSCDQQFDGKDKRDAHHRKEHQNFVTVKTMDHQQQRIMRSIIKKFDCLCGKKFSHVQSLQHHFKTCKDGIFAIEDESSNHDEDTHQFMSRFFAQIIMNLLMIELNTESTNSSADVMDLEVRDHVIDMPISIDDMYDLIICKNCGIGVPFERVPSHLWGNHGIKVTLNQVMTHLKLENETMTIAQAED